MWPLLFSLGPFQLRTLSVFLMVAFLCCGFIFWRKGREEHYQEADIFDGFLLSTLVGLFWARVGFIIMHFDRFQFSPLAWLDIFAFPGISYLVGGVAAGIYLFRYARANKWDTFEILDFWSMGMCGALVFIFFGLFLDGTGFGVPTTLPWGLVFPGVFEKHHPNQLYFALFYILLFAYLSRVEYRYRTYNWYRGGKNTAQTGFLLSVFIISSGAFSLVMSVVSFGYSIQGFRVDYILSSVAFIAGLCLLYNRSGRSLVFWSKRSDSLKHFKV